MPEQTFSVGKALGGPVGKIVGPGGPKSDEINARVSAGEYIVNTAAAQKVGYPFLDDLNQGKVKFAAGGVVGNTVVQNPVTGPIQLKVTAENPELMRNIRMQTTKLDEVVQASRDKINIKEGVSEVSKDTTVQETNKKLEKVANDIVQLNSAVDSIGIDADIASVVSVLTTGLDKMASYLGHIDTEIVNQTVILQQQADKTKDMDKMKPDSLTPNYNKPLPTEDSIGIDADIGSAAKGATDALDQLASALGTASSEVGTFTDKVGSGKADKVGSIKADISATNFKPLSQKAREAVGSVWDEKAVGGRVFGAGGPREDKVPAFLSPGEYVIRAASAQRLGFGTLEHMNQKGEVPGLSEGGTQLHPNLKAVKQMRAIGMSDEDILRELGGLSKPFIEPQSVVLGGIAARGPLELLKRGTALTMNQLAKEQLIKRLPMELFSSTKAGIGKIFGSSGRPTVSPIHRSDGGGVKTFTIGDQKGRSYPALTPEEQALINKQKDQEKTAPTLSENILKKYVKEKTAIGGTLQDRKDKMEEYRKAIGYADGGSAEKRFKVIGMHTGLSMPIEDDEEKDVKKPGFLDRMAEKFAIKKKQLGPEDLGSGMLSQTAEKLKEQNEYYEKLKKGLGFADGGSIEKYFKIDPKTGKAFNSLDLFMDSQRNPKSSLQTPLSEIMSETAGLQKSSRSEIMNNMDKAAQLKLMNLLGGYAAGGRVYYNKEGQEVTEKEYKKLAEEHNKYIAKAKTTPKDKPKEPRYFSDANLVAGETWADPKKMEMSKTKFEAMRDEQKKVSRGLLGARPKTEEASLPNKRDLLAKFIDKPAIGKIPVSGEDKHLTPNLIKQMEKNTIGPGYGIPEYKTPPTTPAKGVTIPGGVGGKPVGPEFFDNATKIKELKAKYGDAGVGFFGTVGSIVKKLGNVLDSPLKNLDKTISGTGFGKMMKGFIKPEIYYPGDDENVVPTTTSTTLANTTLAKAKTNVPIKDLDNIAKGIMATGPKKKFELPKEDWAIKTASDVIDRMKKNYTTEEYDKYISSFYSDNILKQMFTDYIKQFGEDGYKQAMLDLNLQSPDPHIFGGTKFGEKGPIRKRYNPFQAKLAMKESKDKAKDLKAQWESGKTPEAVFERRHRVGDIRTGLTGDTMSLQEIRETDAAIMAGHATGFAGKKGKELTQYQSIYNPLQGKITKDMLASVGPKKSGAAMADPVFAKMMQDKAVERKKLENSIISTVPGSEKHKEMQKALSLLNEMSNLKKEGKTQKEFDKEYNKKYNEYNKLIESSVLESEAITPDSPLFNQLQSREKFYVQMHLRAKRVLGTYEESLKEHYDQTGLDYKGKDKKRYEDELKQRKNNIHRQLLYTSTILTQIKSGKSPLDLQEFAKYQNPEGKVRAFKDQWKNLQPESMVKVSRELDRGLIQPYQQEKFESGLGKTLKGTGFTADDVYAPGFPPQYLEQLKKMGGFGRQVLKLRNFIWMMRKSLQPEEMGLTKKDLLLKRLREFYAQKGYKNITDAPVDMPFSEGGQVNSMRVMHAGGVVSKSGPVFAQKGEVFFPKSMAEGGPVADGVSKLMEKDLPNLKDLALKIDTGELKALLGRELKVENIELKVEDKVLEVEDKTFTIEDKVFLVEDKVFTLEDTVLKVEDVILRVDDTPIKLDVGDLAADVATAVQNAVANVTIKAELAGGAVGADEFASISEAVNNVNDKVIALNKDMEGKIEMLGTTNEQNILNRVEGMIKSSINDTILEVRTTDNVVDNLRSEVQREKDLNTYRMSEIDRKIGEIYNIIT